MDAPEIKILTDKQVRSFYDMIGMDWLHDQCQKFSDFQRANSPSGRWWHRPPNMSPYVPLYYWTVLLQGREFPEDDPHGVWRGDPQKIHARILAGLFEFEDCWAADNVVRNNLRNMLRSVRRFYGFLHELHLSAGSKWPGTSVTPFFFDPSAETGSADIRVVQDGTTYDIQCKSRDPYSAAGLPYDSYLYLAGIVAKAVQDSERSMAVHLHVKQPMSPGVVQSLGKRILRMGRSGLIVIDPVKGKSYEAWMHFQGKHSQAELIQFAKSQATAMGSDPWYIDIQEFQHEGTDITDSSIFIVTGSKNPSLHRFVMNQCDTAAKDYTGSNPFIPSIFLYQELNVHTYFKQPHIREVMGPWEQKFFQKNPHVPSIMIGSNRHQYVGPSEEQQRLSTNYLLIDNPYWDGRKVVFGRPG